VNCELKELADRFPNKEAWNNHLIALGYYLPHIKTYKWAWGLRQYFNNTCNFLFFLKTMLI